MHRETPFVIAGYLLILGWFVLPLLYVPVYVPYERYRGVTIIAAFGDSIFQGLYVPNRDTIPVLLRDTLRADGYNVDVINDGFSGETTSDALRRVGDIIAQRPDIVILEFGTNDIAYGFLASQTRANLEEIMSRLHQASIATLIVGQKAFPSRGPQYAADFDPLFCNLAKRFDAACYPDLFKSIRNRPGMIENFYHPTAQGMKCIADDIYPLVVELLRSRRKH